MIRIAHTADIHIRALSRHDEYRETFQHFIDDCREQRVDHIFIGGDIFHTKTTGISPEYIDLLSWWLTEMAKVALVHMILGNHDGNLVNMTRQDAVSPIVDALGNPRIYLYKKSGVYQFAPGYNLCVYSLFDEEGWDAVKPISGDFNIGCYHGSVLGSKTESDWAVEDGLSISFFKDYDITLLGDIHKRQFLAYRNYMPTMAYPGTLIQQNYAEELDHGYLVWNIHSHAEWDVEYRSLPNTKPFVTIEWAGSAENTFSLANDFPQGSRFRIKSFVHVSHHEVQELTSRLKQELQASEVTFKIDQQVDKEVIATETQVLHRADLREPDMLLSLMKNYHISSGQPEETWQKAGEQIKSYLSQVASSDDSVRNAKWSLKSLKFDNLFSYGDGNEINFDNLNGIIGIFGSNRAGKSSIVGSIMYSLFNTTDRGPMKNLYVCNIRKPFCYSRASIRVNGVDYVIERQTTKSENKKGIVSAATALNLYKIDSRGEAHDLAGEQRNDTEKVIRRLIGNPEDFLMTSLSAQGEINQFIQHGSSKRRTILSKFLDLDVFEKMYELANKDLSTSKAQLKILPERDWKTLESTNKIALLECSSNIENITESVRESAERLSELKSEYSRHSNFTPVTQTQVEVQRSKLAELERRLVDSQMSLDTIQDESEKIRNKVQQINSLSEENDILVLKKKQESFMLLESSVKELKLMHEKEATALKQQERSLKILDEVPCGDMFPTCKFIKDAHVVKNKIEDQKVKSAKALEKLGKATESLENLRVENITDKVNKLQKLQDMHTKLTIDLSKKQTEIVKIENSIESLTTTIKPARTRLCELEEALKNDENVEVVSLRSEIDVLTKKIAQFDSEKIQLASKIGKLNSELEKLNDEKDARESVLQKMKVHELIATAFSRKGVPSVVVASQMPAINAEISKILSGIVDFTVELEIDDESDSMEVYINYGDSRRIIELGSGMEKMISSIAIRVALINISSLPKTDMFIIDEGFGALDDTGVEACNRLLTSLKRYFKTVIVITHVDGVKDAADIVLEITKNEKDSKVVYE
jgi:DNA repair exonuclease SbcCD ATPase subunit/DNA repair exonuclease SbcCD nuclease subunit